MPRSSRGVIAVAGALAQRPRRGGHAWVFLQYLLGFRRLGWEVLFLDQAGEGSWVDDAGMPCSRQESVNLAYLDAVMKEHGLGQDYALLDSDTGAIHGLSRAAVEERLKRSPIILNVMGYLGDQDLLGLPYARVFLDIDPGFGQMWWELGLADPYLHHDVFATVGEAIGSEGCAVPTAGREWIPTPPPVVLDMWPYATGPAATFRGIGAWRGPDAPVAFRGDTYGLRVHEFRRLAALPREAAVACEYALDIHSAETADIELLTAGGWVISDPLAVAATPGQYRTFVQASRGEIMVAKSMYVRSRGGWSSDRSACFLASGRPVIAQATGNPRRYAAGLLHFQSPEEARAALQEVSAHYQHHRRAARDIAEAVHDSDLVLPRLLDSVLAA